MTIYPVYVEQLLVLGNIPDDQAVELGIAYRHDNDDHVRHVIASVIAPYFSRWDDESKAHARSALALVLAEDEEQWFVDAWEADLPPVSLPSEPLRFAQLLWEQLFPGDDPEAVVPVDADVVVDADPTACNRMRVAPTDGPEIAADLLDLPGR